MILKVATDRPLILSLSDEHIAHNEEIVDEFCRLCKRSLLKYLLAFHYVTSSWHFYKGLPYVE